MRLRLACTVLYFNKKYFPKTFQIKVKKFFVTK